MQMKFRQVMAFLMAIILTVSVNFYPVSAQSEEETISERMEAFYNAVTKYDYNLINECVHPYWKDTLRKLENDINEYGGDIGGYVQGAVYYLSDSKITGSLEDFNTIEIQVTSDKAAVKVMAVNNYLKEYVSITEKVLLNFHCEKQQGTWHIRSVDLENRGDASEVNDSLTPQNILDGTYYYNRCSTNGQISYAISIVSITFKGENFENSHGETGKVEYNGSDIYITYDKILSGFSFRTDFPLKAKVEVLDSNEIKITYLNIAEIREHLKGVDFHEFWKKSEVNSNHNAASDSFNGFYLTTDFDPTPSDTIILESFRGGGKSATVNIIAPSDWTIKKKSGGNWLTIETTKGSGNGSTSFKIAENKAKEPRSVEILVACGKETRRILIYQKYSNVTREQERKHDLEQQDKIDLLLKQERYSEDVWYSLDGFENFFTDLYFGDSEKLSDYFDTYDDEYFGNSDIWRLSDYDKRIVILRSFYKDLCNIMGVQQVPLRIGIEPGGGVGHSEWISSNDVFFLINGVYLSKEYLEEEKEELGGSYHMLSIALVHEVRHIYQCESIDNPLRYVVSDETRIQWKNNYKSKNQIKPETDKLGYYAQPIEWDALNFSKHYEIIVEVLKSNVIPLYEGSWTKDE